MNVFMIAFAVIMMMALIGAISTMFASEDDMMEIGVNLGR